MFWLSLQQYVRLCLNSVGNFNLTDHPQVLSLGQFATQYVALSDDLGRTSVFLSTSSHVDALNRSSRVGVVLFVLTLYASKAASIALTSRFAKQKRHIATIYAVLGFTTLLGVATLFELNIDCGLTGRFYWRIMRDSEQCPNQVPPPPSS